MFTPRSLWPLLRRHGLLVLTATAVTAGLAGLGFWQLDRAAQKKALAERIAERDVAGPRSVAQLLRRDDPAHYPVRARGRFDNQHAILRDNRMLDGRAGYHLLMPFRTESGHWVLVNRGWLPRGPSREQLPDIPAVQGTVQIRGHVHVNREKTLVLDEQRNLESGWPLRVQQVDRAALSRRLGVELAPFIVRLAPEAGPKQGAGLPRVWHERHMGPQRHYAYAFQWFAMAAIAPWLFLLAGRRRQQRESS
jgi:surfeit locus 1 family protein